MTKNVCFRKISLEGCQADDQNTRAASLTAVGNNGLISHAAHDMLYSAQCFGKWGEKCFFVCIPSPHCDPCSMFTVHALFCSYEWIAFSQPWLNWSIPILAEWGLSLSSQDTRIVLGPSVCPSVRLMLHLCGFSFFSCHSIFKDFFPAPSMTLKPAPLDFFKLGGLESCG